MITYLHALILTLLKARFRNYDFQHHMRVKTPVDSVRCLHSLMINSKAYSRTAVCDRIQEVHGFCL